MSHTVEQGTFTPRVPDTFTAIRYDGSSEAAAAVQALLAVGYGQIVKQTAEALVLDFPDEIVTVPAGSWVWFDDHGYDRAPASVLDDDAFRASYVATP